MQNNKLNTLLGLLSPIEIKWFKGYVGSPYFNRNPEVTKLLELIVNTNNRFPNLVFNKRNAFKYLFPDEPYREQKLYDHISFLYRLLEGFLAQQKFDQDTALNKRFLLCQLREKEQERLFEISWKSTQRMQQKKPYKNETHYLSEYLLESEADDFFLQQESRSLSDSLQKTVDNLDLFYLSAKLRNTCEMINRSNIINAEYDFRLVDELKQYLETNIGQFRQDPSIVIYYRILLTLTEPEKETHYDRLVGLLEKHAGQFPKMEARNMYNSAQNYCIKKINSGQDSFLKALFDLYQIQINKEIIYEDGVMTQWDYKNIITAGLRLKNFPWVEKFIHKNRNHLSEGLRENAFSYNLANFYYEKGEFGKALKLLQTVEFTDVYYGLSARSLLLKIYYEQEDTEALYSLINAFKIYLKRNKLVSKYQYRVHMNLVRLVRKTSQLRLSMPKSKTEKFLQKAHALKEKIDETKEVTNIGWLLREVDALRK